MANKITVEAHQSLINLVQQGWGIRRIARKLELSRNTVRSYVRSLRSSGALATTASIQTDPLSTTGSLNQVSQIDPLSTAGNMGRKSLCADYAAIILPMVEAGLTAQRIYQDLRGQNDFKGSYESVKRHVRQLRHSDPKLVHRIEVQPGEEVQVDFGAGPTLLDAQGKRRKTWIFRIVLSYSRKAYSQAVRRQDTETFLRCLEQAFWAFGGSTLTINLDNLKAAVLKADWADPELNPKLVDFSRHYHTTILPCLPRVPEHKGKVENSISYVKENALAGRKFSSLPELNLALAHWEKTVADQRIHGTTKRQVAQHFALEKPALQPLPPTIFASFREGPRTVHRDGHVEVERAYYHVPPEYLRQEVWVRFDGREVRIFSKNNDGSLKQIQVHRRLEPGQFTNARGIGGGQGSLQVNLDYWLKRASQLGPSSKKWAQAVVENRGIGGMRSLMGLVALIDRHSLGAVNRACEHALAKGTWRLRDVRALLDAKELQTQLIFEDRHLLIRELSEYGIFIRTKTQNL